MEKMKIMIYFKRSCTCTAALGAPDPAPGHCRPTPPPETAGHSRASLAQSLAGSLLRSPGSWCAQGSVCARHESASPGLCKFGLLYVGANGDLLLRAYATGCVTQVCCTQGPRGRPLLTCTSTGDTHTRFWLSLCGVSGS